jgi:hypothetical protein
MPRGKPKRREGSDMLAWRSRQAPGAIMKPETFEKIMKKAEAQGLSKARAKKVAGSAYWQTVESKYKERKKK